MEPRSIPHTDLPGVSRLFSDFLYDTARTSDFYAWSPWDPSSFVAAAAGISYPADRREALVAALRIHNGDQPSLELLARPDTLVVATGQQAGMFGGPAYTIYKALTAVQLARRLSARGLPTVPVFWMATEDHDFEEVNHCWVFDASHRPVRLEAASQADQQPVGTVPFDALAGATLRQALDGLPYAGQVADLAEESYAPGKTFGAAFRGLLARLLSSYGLLYLDPLLPAVREIAAPLMGRALAKSADMVLGLLERNAALEKAGYHAQVHVEPDSSLLFLLEGGCRLPLRRQDRDFTCGGQRLSLTELFARQADLSPNALLRPVLQDFLLPTVASVLGPAEVAYMAQAQVLYQELAERMPVVVPRASFTLLDSPSAKRMSRYGLSLSDCFGGEAAIRDRIARTLIPPSLIHSLERTTAQTEIGLNRLRDDLMSFDPTLTEALARSRRKMLHQLSKIEGKVARESLRRNERAAADAARLSNMLYPNGHMQERFYSILPLVAQCGLDLIDTIYHAIQLDSPDHQQLAV